MKENRYCVYLHKLGDGTVFYVGNGTIDRANNIYARNKVWKEIVANNPDWSIHIVKSNLSKEEAHNIESEYLANKPPANIAGPKKLRNTLDPEKLKKAFYVDPTSPTGLRFAENPEAKYSRPAHSPAGYYNYKDGVPKQIRVNYENVVYCVHRIVWVLTHGVEALSKPGMVIDHIDRNPFNNKIENLRVVSSRENAENSIRSSNEQICNNNTGISGLVYYENNKGYSMYIVQKKIAGVKHSRAFGINKYGKEVAFEMAKEYLKSVLEKYEQ